MMLSILVAIAVFYPAPQQLPKWAQPEVRRAWADKVPMSEFRRSLQRLRFEVDVIDEKAVRKLYDDAFKGWRSGRSSATAFPLLSLFAYFPVLSSSRFSQAELAALDACIEFVGDSSNIEYAFVAACAYAQDRRGKLDLPLYELFLKRAAGDPQLAPLSYYLLSHHSNVTEQRKLSVDLIKGIAAKYPLRDEYWSALLMAANWNIWSSAGKQESYRAEAVKYAKAVLSHPQSGKDSKRTAEMLLKEMGG